MQHRQTKKFKQTEIGMIPEGWEVKELGEYVELEKGMSYKSEDYCAENEGYIFINLKCVAPRGGFRKDGIKFIKIKPGESEFVEEGDILIANTDLTQNREVIGSPIRIPKLNRKACFSLDLSKLRIIKEIDKNFLFYFLRAPYARNFMVSSGTGTTVVHLAISNVPNMIILLPPLPEQRAIAKVLSAFDDKIELLQKMNKTLEAIGQAIFKHWFVDFEFPNEEGKPYKSSGGEMVYNEELGKEIPKGWEVKELKEIVSRIGPGTNFQPSRIEKGIPFLNVKNISSGFLDLKDIKYISENDFKIVHKYWVPEEHDVLISRIGTLGNVAIIRKEDLPLCVHYNLIDIKPKNTSHAFLYFLLISEFFQKEFHLRKVQTVQEYITIENVEKIKITLPSINTLRLMDIHFLNILIKMEKNFQQIQILSSLRDSLLPKLMSGKIRVPVEVRT